MPFQSAYALFIFRIEGYMGERLCSASTPLWGGYFCRVFTVFLPCFFRVVFESFSRCISNRLLMECTKTVDYWQRDRGGIARNREGNREADRERTGRERGGNGGFFTKLPYRIRFFLHMSRKSINFAGAFGEICFRFSRLVPDTAG